MENNECCQINTSKNQLQLKSK